MPKQGVVPQAVGEAAQRVPLRLRAHPAVPVVLRQVPGAAEERVQAQDREHKQPHKGEEPAGAQQGQQMILLLVHCKSISGLGLFPLLYI